MQIKNIGVFFGGKSPEHDISIITGQLIIAELKKMGGYEVTPVYLDKEENFYIDKQFDNIKFFSQAGYEKKLLDMDKFCIDLGSAKEKLVFKKKKLMSSEKITIDLAFPAFHGNLGEDGSIQGLFEVLNIPYVGCGVAASGIAMDKILAKIFYQGIGVKTTKFQYFDINEWLADKNAILDKIKNGLTWPVFVKPPLLGSSIGIAKVKDFAELENAIEVAFYYNNRVLVEEGVENLMDVTCAVIGHHELTASLVQESSFSSDLFSYDDKYLDNGGAQLGNAEKKLFIPARLDNDITNYIQETSKQIFKALGCSGIARFDFLYNKETKECFANEINPLPGTLYHHLWQKSGIEIQALIKILVDIAIEKQTEKNKIIYTFSSNILESLKGLKLNLKK